MMMQFEHKTAAVGVHDENAMGQDGWELVAVNGGIAFYKRAVATVENDTAAAVNRVHDVMSELLDHMRKAQPVMAPALSETAADHVAMPAGDEQETVAASEPATVTDVAAEHEAPALSETGEAAASQSEEHQPVA